MIQYQNKQRFFW